MKPKQKIPRLSMKMLEATGTVPARRLITRRNAARDPDRSGWLTGPTGRSDSETLRAAGEACISKADFLLRAPIRRIA
ncbi:hypothetical protein IT41_19690 [Paracoccus halophilus]|uniref:Uncharacterized protein n=1 Tax=Paracoccus halophilus TaxID=376733 RepID=A0A099ET75_9RHOB|nr:hypothetical protein IT41_19690 [Paracoccus halophilus]